MMKTADENFCELMENLRGISERVSIRSSFIGEIYGPLRSNSVLCALFQHSPKPGANHIVHYTSWESALNIFRENGNPILRMYNYERSNDPDEGKIKPKEWKDLENDVKSIDKNRKNNGGEQNGFECGEDTYGCSFSSGGEGIEDELTYWRMYGNDGEGCSLKITLPSAIKQTSPGAHGHEIFEVLYRDRNSTDKCDRKEDGEIAERLRKILTVCKEIIYKTNGKYPRVEKFIANRLREIVCGCYHLVKHKNYAVEQEWRMIRVAPKQEAIQFDTTAGKLVKRYVEGPHLSKILSSGSVITIGPTVPNPGAARAYIEYLVKTKHGMGDVKVRNSRQTYRRQS